MNPAEWRTAAVGARVRGRPDTYRRGDRGHGQARAPRPSRLQWQYQPKRRGSGWNRPSLHSATASGACWKRTQASGPPWPKLWPRRMTMRSRWYQRSPGVRRPNSRRSALFRLRAFSTTSFRPPKAFPPPEPDGATTPARRFGPGDSTRPGSARSVPWRSLRRSAAALSV